MLYFHFFLNFRRLNNHIFITVTIIMGLVKTKILLIEHFIIEIFADKTYTSVGECRQIYIHVLKVVHETHCTCTQTCTQTHCTCTCTQTHYMYIHVQDKGPYFMLKHNHSYIHKVNTQSHCISQ